MTRLGDAFCEDTLLLAPRNGSRERPRLGRHERLKSAEVSRVSLSVTYFLLSDPRLRGGRLDSDSKSRSLNTLPDSLTFYGESHLLSHPTTTRTADPADLGTCDDAAMSGESGCRFCSPQGGLRGLFRRITSKINSLYCELLQWPHCLFVRFCVFM